MSGFKSPQQRVKDIDPALFSFISYQLKLIVKLVFSLHYLYVDVTLIEVTFLHRSVGCRNVNSVYFFKNVPLNHTCSKLFMVFCLTLRGRKKAPIKVRKRWKTITQSHVGFG